MPDIAKTHKVLVIDDEDEVREMIRRILRFSAYEVVEARDGNEGYQVALTENPDLITLDIMMPGKNGFTLCEELKRNPKTRHIPIIVLTVAASRRRAMNVGADYYMNKLFSVDEFVKVIDRLIQGPVNPDPPAA